MSALSVGVIDSNICNLTSVLNALRILGFAAECVEDPEAIRTFSHLVLPGVGTFAKGMERLRLTGLDEAISSAASAGKPLLGICLGMQLLADEGTEFGLTKGLGLVPGSVTLLTPNSIDCRIPHIGWNAVETLKDSRIFRGMLEQPPCFYFVHSFGFSEPRSSVVSGITDHGGSVVAAVEKDNVYGVQFHPERSQRCGLTLLKNFVTLC